MHWSSGHAITQNENTFLPTYAECKNVEDITQTINQKYPKQPTYPHIISDELSPFARIVAPKESQIKTVQENVRPRCLELKRSTQMLGAQAI